MKRFRPVASGAFRRAGGPARDPAPACEPAPESVPAECSEPQARFADDSPAVRLRSVLLARSSPARWRAARALPAQRNRRRLPQVLEGSRLTSGSPGFVSAFCAQYSSIRAVKIRKWRREYDRFPEGSRQQSAEADRSERSGSEITTGPLIVASDF